MVIVKVVLPFSRPSPTHLMYGCRGVRVLVEEEGEGVVLGFGEHAGEGGEDGDGDLDDHAPGFGREFLFHRAGC